jgi:hypothetical protein
MKWLKKLILKKENDLKYKEERAKSNRELLTPSHLTLKVVLDKIEDKRIEKSNKDVCQSKIN